MATEDVRHAARPKRPNDSGQYRLVVPPGDLVVMGQMREMWPLEGDPTQMRRHFYDGSDVHAIGEEPVSKESPREVNQSSGLMRMFL
jgi:hypothetical protein